METLREMFPALPENALRQALETADSVEDAAMNLLEAEPPAGIDIPPHPAPPKAPSPQLEEIIDVRDEAGDDSEVLVVPDDRQKVDQIQKLTDLDDSLAKVVSIFPDVCTDHVKKEYGEHVKRQGHNIVDYIVNSLIELGPKYPRAETDNPRKRKRSDSSNQNQFENPNREQPEGYKSIARKFLQREFPLCPVAYIDRVMLHNKFLSQAYAVIGSVYDDPKPPFDRLKNPRKPDAELDTLSKVHLEASSELKYAREKAKVKKHNAQLEADAKLAATLDLEEHEENGMMIECQCCYGESPFSGMTQCNEGHLFCLDCARRNAENEVGRGRYRLLCMAGCKSEFPRREVLRFLDEKLILALEKNEQEEVLRMADLEDLTKCPFCDYAAICAPIEEDKEFRCGNPDCMEISCRHCQQKSHIPLTCEEVSKDGKLSIRHKLEEAMTQALVRTCKKCNNKFIKESGCNKMACSRCRTLQCYVCSETIKGYDHFNDPSRGGSTTNKCPLFDNTDERHDEEVEKAAKLVMEQLKVENPHITDEDLEIKLSEAVKKKKAANPVPGLPPPRDQAHGAMHAQFPPPMPVPPIEHFLPLAQPPPRLGMDARLQAIVGQIREGSRRNALQMNAVREALQANLAQPGRTRQQMRGAAQREAQQAAAHQVATAQQQVAAAQGQARAAAQQQATQQQAAAAQGQARAAAQQQAAAAQRQARAAAQQQAAAAQQQAAAAQRQARAAAQQQAASAQQQAAAAQRQARVAARSLPRIAFPSQRQPPAAAQPQAAEAQAHLAAARQQAGPFPFNYAVQVAAAQPGQLNQHSPRQGRQNAVPFLGYNHAPAPAPALPMQQWPGANPAQQMPGGNFIFASPGLPGWVAPFNYPGQFLGQAQAATAAAAVGGNAQPAAAVQGGIIPAAGQHSATAAPNQPVTGRPRPYGWRQQ